MKDVVRANFDDSVDAYVTYEQRTGRFTALARLLAAEMSARTDTGFGTVLDAGAGTGVSTRVFADTGANTVALDISREMLSEVNSPLCVEADFDTLPLADRSVDGVAFTASLFLVPDPAITVREAARVLRSGGVVGAVAPLGWVDQNGDDVFNRLERDSRSPTGADEVTDAIARTFTTTTGTWRFSTTAADLRRFHAIPAMAARLYPEQDADERVEKAHALLDSLEGTFEQQWRWIVGVAD
ncbi:MAG: class I SAM-dependent methyltransferase [Haloarcula sp.]